MRRIKDAILDSEIPIWNWILLLFTTLICFLFYWYADLKLTTSDSLALIDCTLKGQFFSFYKINPCAYDIIVYILLAIWNIPLWIASRIFEVDLFASFAALLWAKLALIPYVILVCNLIRKICVLIGMGKKDSIQCIFVFLSSIFFMSSVMMQNGVDIISVFFTLLGIYFYLDENQKNWKWIFIFAIAVTFKMFAFMIFIPLLLLKEKKISKILIATLEVISITAVARILFKVLSVSSASVGQSNIASEAVSQTTQGIGVFQGGFMMVDLIFTGKVDLFIEKVSLWAIAMTVLCIYCYLKQISRDDKGIWTIYISFLSYLIFIICSRIHPFWMVLILPYLSILTMYNKDNCRKLLLIESIGSIALIISQNITFYWCFSSIRNLTSLICPRLFGTIPESYWDMDITNFLAGHIGPDWIARIESLAGGIFVGAILVFSYLVYPREQKKKNEQIQQLSFNSILLFRIFVSVMMYTVPILFYVFITRKYNL